MRDKLEKKYAKVKEVVDKHRREDIFNNGKKKIANAPNQKLLQKKYAPFKVAKKLSNNAYKVKLPFCMGKSRQHLMRRI